MYRSACHPALIGGNPDSAGLARSCVRKARARWVSKTQLVIFAPPLRLDELPLATGDVVGPVVAEGGRMRFDRLPDR